MKTSEMSLVVDIKLAWWLKYLYLPLLIGFARFCIWLNPEAEPNWDRIHKVLEKGVKISKPRTVYHD